MARQVSTHKRNRDRWGPPIALKCVDGKLHLLLLLPPCGAGTGKTTLVELLAPKVGLCLVTPAFPGAQINGGLVGDNEKCLRDLFNR